MASQGIDTGDFSASERLRSAPERTKLLLEMLLIQGGADFLIGYVTIFDAGVEFPRYFPERAVADTIELPQGSKPASGAVWEPSLMERTAFAKARLKPRN